MFTIPENLNRNLVRKPVHKLFLSVIPEESILSATETKLIFKGMVKGGTGKEDASLGDSDTNLYNFSRIVNNFKITVIIKGS